MPQCAVTNCNNTHRKTKGGSVRYHRFPGDADTRARWVQACGRHVQNCATARVCSRHFSEDSYERDVQHELLGLPTRCRLKRGAIPDINLPLDVLREDDDFQGRDSAIAVLLAVGLVPNAQSIERTNGGLPLDLNKMHVMEEVHEGCDTQPSSPGHADERQAMIELCSKDEICKKEIDDSSPSETDLKIAEIKQETDGNAVKVENSAENHSSAPSELTNGESEITHGNDDSGSNDSSTDLPLKRKLESDSNDSPMKKLHVELQRNFAMRDKFLKKCMETVGGNNFEQIQANTEQILSEIRTLNEMAKQKEKEWNNILHLKKLKEELLLRLERKKQLLLLNFDDFDGESFESERYSNENKSRNNRNYVERNQLVYRQRNFNGRNSSCNNLEVGGPSDYRQSKQRPLLDVKSIIADYRQKHPETVPRRGRRIRSVAQQNDQKHCGTVLNLSNMALGSGAQVVHNPPNAEMNRDLQILNTMEELRREQGLNSDQNSSDLPSFKDMLVQFAKLSQSEKQEILRTTAKPPPPPYPEVTVHPVPTTSSSNSLLHGILTKNQPPKSDTKSTFSPTLARLLTAPEKSNSQGSNHSNVSTHSNVASISDILSHSKTRNEITITPVMDQYVNIKVKNPLEDDEAEDSVDRLVIDEGGEAVDGRSKDNNSDGGDEVPQCQGCNQKPAQFVCAGCGNQWYCSRDCQVAAWDEHSEVCSG